MFYCEYLLYACLCVKLGMEVLQKRDMATTQQYNVLSKHELCLAWVGKIWLN